MTTQRILLCTECTEFDVGAERLALAMAGRCARALAVVMPLVSNPEYEAVAPQIAAHAEQEAATRLASLRDQARAAGIDIDARIRRGAEIWREVVDDAQEREADLLVIRRRGRRSFLSKLLVGEMVNQVLAHAPCDVLVVPRDAAMWSRRVLVAAQPGEPGDRLLALGLSVAAECALPLSVLCLLADADPAHQRLGDDFLTETRRLALKAGVAVEGELLADPSAARILAASRRHGADLIVIEGCARGARPHPGDVARQVTGLTPCAVLLARLD